MADTRGMANEEGLEPVIDESRNSALLPTAVRRWIVGGLVVLVAVAAYLIAVRGTAILFDLRDAVSAICM